MALVYLKLMDFYVLNASFGFFGGAPGYGIWQTRLANLPGKVVFLWGLWEWRMEL